MSPTQGPAGRGADADESPKDQVRPIPDEYGPHDVPDEKVIDETLPAKPVPDSSGSAPR